MWLSRALNVVAAIAAVLIVAHESPAASAMVCGDCDRSGAVSITDALFASQVAVGTRAWVQDDLATCDANSSSVIDVIDGLVIAQVSAGLPVALICPPPLLAAIDNLALASPASGVVLITYELIDPDSDLCDLECMVSSDGGLTFPIAATLAPGGDGASGLTSSPAGIAHTFAWDSVADLGASISFTVELRFVPLDPAPGIVGFLGPLLIDNRLPGVVSYALDIEPMIHDVTPVGIGCIVCHNSSFPPAGFDVSTYSTLMIGGITGAVVIPFDPDSSIIVCKVEGAVGCGSQMPIAGQPWSPAQTQTLRDWILQGALDN